ncbi:MAG: peptide chain release factor H [Cryomorphaceae bacterium]|nr:peptide chain release factor H [Cryomorphaceae bacterium]
MKNSEKILQITAGKGPAECTWVAAQVLKKIMDEAQRCGLKTTVLSREVGSENGTIETAIVRFSGKEVDQFAAQWIGTIQWIGKSTFRKFHKRKNWYIGVFEVETSTDQAFSEQDVDFQAMRSSGPGGQHVNKVSSAIRATHKPTGLQVVAMDSRSQYQNKKLAIERLKDKWLSAQNKAWSESTQKQWLNQTQVERGNPVRIFEDSNFKKRKSKPSFKQKRLELKQDLKNENR